LLQAPGEQKSQQENPVPPSTKPNSKLPPSTSTPSLASTKTSKSVALKPDATQTKTSTPPPAQPAPAPNVPVQAPLPVPPPFAFCSPVGQSPAPSNVTPGQNPAYTYAPPAPFIPPGYPHYPLFGAQPYPSWYGQYPNSVQGLINPNKSKDLMEAFKSITKLKSNNTEHFLTWKTEIATQLNANSSWEQLVLEISPPEFLPTPVPSNLQHINQYLFAAIKSAMEDDIKILIKEGTTGGLELLESLTDALSPTLDPTTIQSYKSEVQIPRRHNNEKPLDYFLRIKSKKNILLDNGIDLGGLEAQDNVTGLVNTKQLLQNNRVAFTDEVTNINKYDIWPATWKLNQYNLRNLAMQINYEYEGMTFESSTQHEEGGTTRDPSSEYKRINKVTRPTSRTHKFEVLKFIR